MPSEILVQIRGAYPELDSVPDADLITGINEQVPEVGAAIRWELGREAKLNLGRERIASETPGEYLITDEQAAAPGALGKVEQFLAPGGRAIARGAGQMITGSLAAQDAFAAAPRVWFGENPVTSAFETLNKPSLAADVVRDQARASADRPSYGAQSLGEAWDGGAAETAQFMVERGLEQVPQMVAGIGTGGAMAAAGVPAKLAAILGIGATTLPQETGGAYEEIKQVSGNESPATAALVGGLNTGLEMVGDAKMFQRALGGDRIIADTAGKYIRSALGRAAGQGGKEFVTEASQEGVTAGVPYLTGQTEAPQNLGERMLEAGVSALLPGPATSLTTDALGYTQPGALTPPKLTANQIARDAAFEAEQNRQQDRTLLAAQINSARMASQEAQRQAEIDQQLAVQMADVREKADQERALANQYGQLAGAENQIATDQALAEADALLGAMLAKRQSQAMDIPELTPGIAAEPTSTTLRMAEEAQRRANMTPEQLAALEVLERGQNQPVEFNRLQQAPVPDTLSGLNDFGEPTIAPTPVDFAVAGLTPRTQPNQQEFEAGLKNGVPAAPSQPTLQEQRQLGGRYAATPDTTSGLSEQAGETIAPSAVDMLLAEDRGALYPVPSRSDFERGLKNGVPDGTRPAGPSYPVPSSAAFDRGLKSGVAPAPRRTGTFSTDSGIAESQADQAMSPVDQYIAGRRPTQAPPIDTSSGLSDAVDASGTTPVDGLIASRRAEANGKQSLQVDQGLYESQQPGGRTPIDNFLSTRKATRKRSALSRSSREETRAERAARAKTQLSGSRQQGQMGTISDKFAPLLEQLASRVPPEEQQRAVSGVPETDDGWALRYIINAREEVDRYLSGTGDQVNDNGRTYMERNYQERVLATLQDPKRTKPLRISFPGRTVLKQSLLNVRQNLAEVGNVTGQSEEGIELTGDSGTFENPALASKATQPAGEAAWNTQEPQSHNAVEIIQNFIDTETSTAEEGQAAYNLILTALGQQPLYTERNTDRQLAERDPLLKAKVAELVRDELRKRILKAHLAGEPRASIGLAAVTAAVRGVTSSDKVQVVYDPDLKDPKGRPVSGYIDAQGNIVINAAFIDSPQMARDVVLEELMHAVYGEADVQQAWDQVRAGVTKAERDAMIAAGYSEDVAVEEAAIRKVIAQINSRNTDNAVTRFLRSVVEAMKRVFGIAGNDPYGVILARALKGGMTKGGQRFSLADGYWKSSAELEQDLAFAGDQRTLAEAAAAQKAIIPPSITAEVDAIKARIAAAPTKRDSASDRAAMRILSPIRNMKELLSGAIASNLPSAWSVAAATGLANISEKARDITAEAILKTHLHLLQMGSKTTERAQEMVSKAAEAFAKLPSANRLEIEADQYRSMADRLAYDFKKNINERVEIAKGSKDEKLVRELAMASRNLTESFRGAGAAVSSALRNIAAQIPDSALATPESARQWIEARVNDKTQPPIMSQIAADWLFTKPDGRLSTPIEWDKRLNERLRLMKELADEKSQISQDIAAFDQSITGTKKRPSVQQIFQKYVQFRDSHRDSMEKMRLIYREIDKAEAELNGSVTAQQVLQKLLADPAYVARVEEARNHLGALSRGVKLPNGNGPGTSPFGKDTYLHPVTGEQVVIDQIPDVGTEAKNIEKLRTLVKDVQAWMRTSNDPLLRSAWDRELQFIVNKGFAIPPSLQTGFNEFGIRLPSWWQLPFNPVSRTFSMGRLDVANNIWQRVGTRAALRPLQAAQISDRVKKAFEQLAGGNDSSENRIKEKIKAAMTSHGRERLSDIFDWWVPTIVERIISQDQSPTQRPYKVGDYILGHQITREDMDAVEAMKKWQTQASNIVQKNQTLGSYIDPIATEEIVAGRSLVRRSVDYGLKMARTLSDFGRTFTEEFLSADEAGRLEFLDKHFNRTVMGLVHETDGEVAGRLSDMDRAMFIELNKLDRSNALPFADLDGFLDWVGDRAAQTTGRSPADERSEAQARLLDYFEGFATAINNAIGQADRASVEDFEKKGLPVAIVKSVNGGANPFLTPRGRLMGPSTFYQYSMASDGDRGRYKSAAITALTLKEVVEAKNALSAIKRELEKYEGPEGLIAKEQAKGKYRILAKRKVAAESQRRARAKEVMIDYRSLVDHKQAVEVLLAGMERLALEHTVSKEDNAVVSASNNLRSGFVSSVLSSIKSAATNSAGIAIQTMNFRRMLGSYNFLITPPELLWEASRQIAGAVTKGLRAIPGVDPTIQAMAKVPGFDKLITGFINNQLRYEQNRQKAVAAGLVDEPDWIESSRLKKAFPAGAGRLAEGDDNGIFIQGANRVASAPIIRQLIDFSKATFPGAMDRLGNTVFSTLLERWVNDINGPALAAWKRRDTGVEGWDEIGNPMNVFSAEELGLPDNNVLRSWRQILSPAGGLEKLALDFYKRTKGMPKAALKNESMLTPEQMEAISLESAKMVNLPTGSTTPLVSQGKGLSGTVRRWLTLFLRYPIAAQGFLENISATAVGDNPRTSWKVASGVAAIALMLLIGGASMDFGQWMQEVIFNDPRTKMSFAQAVDSGTAKDIAKYGAMSMAAWYPFLGEQIGNAIGGTSGKPLMDANRMIVPFGLANDAYQVISRTLQTGDAFYPVTDFVRRYSPIAGAGMNLLQPGEVEARAALRAARVAATSDMEIRQTGGQGQGSRETPLTPLIRRATNALLVGDEEGYGSAVEQAVQYQVGQGKTPEAARRSVLSSMASREPARRAFGRQITPEESSAIEARMSPVSRQSYQRSRSAFARFRGTGRKRTALGRGRRTRKPRARRRSALVR